MHCLPTGKSSRIEINPVDLEFVVQRCAWDFRQKVRVIPYAEITFDEAEIFIMQKIF
jgi:hypothetical protein